MAKKHFESQCSVRELNHAVEHLKMLRDHVENGGLVYMSGDLNLDVQRDLVRMTDWDFPQQPEPSSVRLHGDITYRFDDQSGEVSDG